MLELFFKSLGTGIKMCLVEVYLQSGNSVLLFSLTGSSQKLLEKQGKTLGGVACAVSCLV